MKPILHMLIITSTVSFLCVRGPKPTLSERTWSIAFMLQGESALLASGFKNNI
jgi:hypothetical protein